MAEYQIKSKDGLTTRATGAPVYNGTYLKPGYLEFREIGSPTPIAWQVGDYVDYTRTGLRYKLYNTPKSRKQAEQNTYGGAFVYENVQFFDITKELELAPFIDLVPYDNQVHFSTLNSVAFIGTPQNVGERIEACLDYWFPLSNWAVTVIDDLDPTEDADLIETLATEAEFSVSGLSCQEALERMYETWNGLGWSFTSSGGTNTITIGAPNKRTVANTTAAYGRIGDNGIVTLARSISNADEIGTRLYAYGSMRNMPSGYYRSKNIKDASSVDIEHLMIPISEWGTTVEGSQTLPDASKAYIESDTAIASLGLIPKYAYFDGSDSKYPEIYPSIVGHTIGDVIDAKAELSDTSYVPSLSKWSRDDRIDEIVSAVNPEDDGGTTSNGTKYSESGTYATNSDSWSSATDGYNTSMDLASRDASSIANAANIILNVTGTVEIDDADLEEIQLSIIVATATNKSEVEIPVTLESTSTSGIYTFKVENGTANLYAADAWKVRATLFVDSTADYAITVNAGTIYIGYYTKITGNTFVVEIPQIGFNIQEYADLGDGKTIAMMSGMCAGRSFQIKAATYISARDTWQLTVSRIKDGDTGVYFPNSDFQIAQGDKYVLLDIAMPELYIEMASGKLLAEAERLLADIDHEKPFYEPGIDSKKVHANSLVLREGMWMHLYGDEIVDDGEDYSLIDTMQIDEGSYNIPTYSVTLRKKKQVEWTESIGASLPTTSSSSSSVSNESTTSRSSNLDWFIVESYLESGATKYRLKVNPKYAGLYAEGWISAGGLSTTGGGAPVAALKDLSDVDDDLNPSAGQVLMYDGTLGKWTAGNGGGGGSYLPLSGGTMTGNIKLTTSLYYNGTGSVQYIDGDTTLGYIGVSKTTDQQAQTTRGTLRIKAYNDIQLYPNNSTSQGLVISSSDVAFLSKSLVRTVKVGNTSYNATTGVVSLPAYPSAPGTLDTTNTMAQTTSASEALTGTVKLHKVSKTGSYSDLLNQPNLSVYVTTTALTTTLASYVTTSSLATTLGDYLPLTGGTLTGVLNIKLPSKENTYYNYFKFLDSDGTNVASIRVTGLGHIGLYANNSIEFMAANSRRFFINSSGLMPEVNGTINIDSTTGAMTSLGNGYDIGRHASGGTTKRFIRSLRTKVIYLDDGVYLYYDTVNQCVRIIGAGLAAEGFVSGGGVSTT